MGKAFGCCPRHGEHQVKRYPKRLSAMHVGEARRICNYRICHKWHPIVATGIRMDTRFPASLQHFVYHPPFPRDLSFSESLHARYEPSIFYHIIRIAPYKVEFEIRLSDKLARNVVCSSPYAMSVFLKLIAKSYKRLDISSAPHYLSG